MTESFKIPDSGFKRAIQPVKQTGASGFRIQDSRVKIQDSGFRIKAVNCVKQSGASGFRIQDLRFRIQDSRLGIYPGFRIQISEFTIQDSIGGGCTFFFGRKNWWENEYPIPQPVPVFK